MPISDRDKPYWISAFANREVAEDAFSKLSTVETSAMDEEAEEEIGFELSLPDYGSGSKPVGATFGTLVYGVFAPADQEFYFYRMPAAFVAGSALKLAVLWTKSANVDESGKQVKWAMDYNIVQRDTVDVSASSEMTATPDATIFFEDTYENNNTASRVIYTTDQVEVSGLTRRDLFIFKIYRVAPSVTPLANNPALVSLSARVLVKVKTPAE